MRRPARAAILVSFVGGALLTAVGPLAAQVGSRAEWIDLGGERFTGAILGVADDRLELADRAPVAIADLESIRLIEAEARPHEPPPGHIWLRSGQDHPATIRSSADGQFAIDLGFGAASSFDPRHLTALRFGTADDDGGFARALADRPRTDDLLFAINPRSGEITRLTVEFLAIESDAITVRFRDQVQRLTLDRVHGLVFGVDHGAPPPPLPRPTVTVTLVGGAAYDGRLTGWSDAAVGLTLAEGPKLDLPTPHVERVDVRSNRVAWLSQMTPAKVEQTPAFDRVRPWLIDRAPNGKGLVIGEQHFDRGLCLIPRTALTYDLEPGAFSEFQAIVGIDDRAGHLGHATVRIRLDGEIAWRHDELIAGRPLGLVTVPLGQARQLTLEADFGPDYDLGDHCAFARARLVADR